VLHYRRDHRYTAGNTAKTPAPNAYPAPASRQCTFCGTAGTCTNNHEKTNGGRLTGTGTVLRAAQRHACSICEENPFS
jgi:hypothetical protein